jgi:hypothetical protein
MGNFRKAISGPLTRFVGYPVFGHSESIEAKIEAPVGKRARLFAGYPAAWPALGTSTLIGEVEPTVTVAFGPRRCDPVSRENNSGNFGI